MRLAKQGLAWRNWCYESLDVLPEPRLCGEIVEHFNQCDPLFAASITEIIALQDYAKKLAEQAWRTEAWQNNTLTGLVAAYYNAQRQQGFITNVSVLPDAQHCGVGSHLLIQSIEHLRSWV